jgi:uncharacterized RDD family membrane protein YckC
MVLDLVVSGVICSPAILACASLSFGNQAVEGSWSYWTCYVLFIISTSFEIFSSRSIGKRLLKLRIEAPTRQRIHARRLARCLIKFLPVHVLVIAIGLSLKGEWQKWAMLSLTIPSLSLLSAVLGSSRRAIHDWICGTSVIVDAPVTQQGFPILTPTSVNRAA